jgi:hypothetical protein
MVWRPKRRIAARVAIAAAMALTVPAAASVSPASATPSGLTAWGLYPPAGPYEVCFAESLCETAPKEVGELSGVKAVSAGGHENLVLLEDGQVWAWGVRPDQSTFGPEELSGLSGVKAISAAGDSSLALLENGTVMAFGTGAGAPEQVSGLSSVTAIAADEDHSLALLSNGKVMAWGYSGLGQLGNGSTEGPEVCGFNNGEPIYCSRTPVPVKGLKEVTAIAAGQNHSLALLKDSTVKAWGSNLRGQLGNGTTSGSDVPVPVSGLSGATAISAGLDFSVAVLEDGTVQAWGSDEFAELGNGVQCPAGEDCHSDLPGPVSGLSGVTAISAGSAHSLALLENHTIMAWGLGRYGELGDRSIQEAAVPVHVFGLREAAGVSAGPDQSLAYGPPIPTITGATPQMGPEGGGTAVAITGINLAEATGVEFGTVAAKSFEVTSPTSISAVSPPGTGAQSVEVSNSAGTDAFFYPFRYEPPPVVSGRAPGKGPATGGTSVKISGSNLVFASAVHFGSIEASSFTVDMTKGKTTITAVSPAAEVAGSANVTVTTPGGTSTISTKDVFKYAPTVTGVSPDTGPTAGATSVIVSGVGFALGTTTTIFKFGTAKAKAVDCTSTTTCTVTAPAHGPGTVDVKATVNKVSGTKNAPADHFTYD